MLSRREFLNFSAATIALTSLPNQIQSKQLIRNYKLTAEITPYSFDTVSYTHLTLPTTLQV